MSLLQQLDIFELRPLITNLSCKLSTISEYDARKQLLCLVTEENDILLCYYYNTDGGAVGPAGSAAAASNGQEVLKLVSWFRRSNRVIHDVCFDPSGTWLLVLCFDNTLHIVPALAVVDKAHSAEQQAQPLPYSTAEVTSYIIPFVGPHECPNSKKCPNHCTSMAAAAPSQRNSTAELEREFLQLRVGEAAAAEQRAQPAGDDVSPRVFIDGDMIVVVPALIPKEPPPTLEAFSHDVPANMLAPPAAGAASEDKTGNSQVMAASFMASNTCPFPLSVVWWQTIDGLNRAAIGYSDGSICFVGLSPNCPFVASTAIESGSVMRLLLCKDNTFESVMLLITSSLKQQFKLLLEQKAIKYVYPGDTSPSTAQGRDSDWQIVMPLKGQHNSNSSGPASDSSQLEEDVFVKGDEVPTKATTTPPPPPPPPQLPAVSYAAAVALPVSQVPPPPPPPYSVAISRTVDSASTDTTAATFTAAVTSTASMASTATTTMAMTTTSTVGVDGGPTASDQSAAAANASAPAGVRLQQLAAVDDFYSCDPGSFSVGGGSAATAAAAAGGAGILPAARARLASLRSLGSKKFNAIKMRLTDNRQKLDEYMPENTLGSSFAIMDSPSLTPELLASNARGSFYTIQNLRNTYLLSALHAQSNSLSVHSIDISLKPLFLYKIPRNCYDILISSNLLYSIQYVDETQSPVEAAATAAATTQQSPEPQPSNTEKENRDTDIERQEKYADDVLDLSDDDDKLMQGASARATGAADSSADTSATNSSGPSTHSCHAPSSLINAVGVISSAMASLRTGAEDKFNVAAQLGLFRFEHETVLSLYQMATLRSGPEGGAEPHLTKEEKAQAFAYKDIRSPLDYVHFYGNAPHAQVQEEFSLRQMEIMQREFPRINYDPCYVITNKNVYYIQLKKDPFAIFLDAALASEWSQCREFCNTFDLSYEACIEFAGDYLLRRKKITQALLTYNAAHIKPIRTALKLAMFGQTNALMHLCAMALKTTHTLKSQYFSHPILRTLLADITYRHSEDVRATLPPKPASYVGHVNEGASCSDYVYGVDEILCNLQMSPSSQFHLANLLVITLAEKAVNDKNYLPLWNFLCTNTKYHTNMTSIVLSQSGLFSAALVLAKTRGVCIDTFLALASVVGQEFGWYNELNVCLYNLSEPMFAETITYVPHIAADYFRFIQEKVDAIRPCVLQRLEQQLNPFSATLRPIVSHTSSAGRLLGCSPSENNSSHAFAYCRTLIETYLAVLIHMASQRCKRDHIVDALTTFRINYEDNQFAIETARFKPISAGCGHCACVMDGIAYFWGSNGVPCNYSVNKTAGLCLHPPEPPHAVKSLELLSQLNLEVHTVKCGRQHSLILTNNGLYAFGNNNLAQLGVGRKLQMSLQPMLLNAFDGKNITVLEAGQYHNAAVADGLLYMWGWGVYGQLGHGDTENVAEPKVVEFFRNKHVLQVSLGHAHSLVLCRGGPEAPNELFAFGSNHFGQLGIGGLPTTASADAASSVRDDDPNCPTSQVKSLVPLRVEMSSASIRLIHTKFFTNLAVDSNERMYTWGSSPQALRLANQIKRRANAKQKIEEHQRREISKRFEATLVTTAAAAAATTSTEEDDTTAASTSKAAQSSSSSPAAASETAAAPTVAAHSEETKEDSEPRTTAAAARSAAGDDIDIDEIDDGATKPTNTRGRSGGKAPTIHVTAAETLTEKRTDLAQQKQPSVEVDPSEHMSPHLVDTSEVAGQILQISSGLFHCALISSTCTLYTWGKNLEHQLGTEDKDRRPVNKPSPIDSIERPMHVDCGADFTLVMTTDHVVKAFGGNTNGQCGRDLGPSIDKLKQRVVCLPTTKRLMRFESQCVDVPVEINLPRPRIRLDTEPVRYLKSIPRYQAHFVLEPQLTMMAAAQQEERPTSSPSPQYQSTTQAESSEDNALTGPDSDDLISSLENLSNNDASSLNISLRANAEQQPQQLSSAGEELLLGDDVESVTPTQQQCASNNDHNQANSPPTEEEEELAESLGDDVELQQLRHYIHYCLYVFHGLYDPAKVRAFSERRLEYRIRTHMLNFKFVDAFTLCLQDCGTAAQTLQLFEYFSKDATGCVPMRRPDLKFLIYYLLLHFLAHKFDLLEAEQYFLADLDYYLLELAYVLYFNNNNTVLEQNLNQKFKELIAPTAAGSSAQKLSGTAQQRENAQTESQSEESSDQEPPEHKLEDTDAIFDCLSVKFKTIVCQRLLKKLGN